jgi:ribosomal protein S18 acetylase RimI-like enzyme
MPVLRLALPGDAPALATLAERTFRDTFGARNSPDNMDLHCSRAFGKDIQLREIGEPGLVTTLADEGGRLAGYSQLRIGKASPAVKAERPAELHRIYVAAEWHGRGIGRAFIERALADAARADCDRLWLGVWEHNPKAIAFYRKLGFEPAGTHAFMLGEERQRDLIMSVAVMQQVHA